MIRGFLALSIVSLFAVPSLFAQKPGNASPAQQALENRLRRFDHLPNSQSGSPFGNPGIGHPGVGIPGIGNSGNHGTQISSSRIPESVRERRDEVFSRRFKNGDTLQELRDRKKPNVGMPPHAAQGQSGWGEVAEEHPGVKRSQFVSHGKNHRAYTQADRLLAKRLEQIDRLREQYLTTGDNQLLEQADKLERLAREQHQFRLEGVEPPSQGSTPLPITSPSATNTSELPSAVTTETP